MRLNYFPSLILARKKGETGASTQQTQRNSSGVKVPPSETKNKITKIRDISRTLRTKSWPCFPLQVWKGGLVREKTFRLPAIHQHFFVKVAQGYNKSNWSTYIVTARIERNRWMTNGRLLNGIVFTKSRLSDILFSTSNRMLRRAAHSGV